MLLCGDYTFSFIFSDIDECALGLDDCQQLCSNSQGAYVCSCQPGSMLQSDNRTCVEGELFSLFGGNILFKTCKLQNEPHLCLYYFILEIPQTTMLPIKFDHCKMLLNNTSSFLKHCFS